MKKKMSSPADQPKMVNLNDDYEVKGHLQDILRAHEIMMDPEKMKKVHKLAGRHMKGIKNIQSLKDTYDEKYGAGALKKLAASDEED